MNQNQQTRNLTFPRSSPSPELMWSASRPGVAITTWGFLESSIPWVSMSMPPTTTLTRALMWAPSATNCSFIWNASSLRWMCVLGNIYWGGVHVFFVFFEEIFSALTKEKRKTYTRKHKYNNAFLFYVVLSNKKSKKCYFCVFTYFDYFLFFQKKLTPFFHSIIWNIIILIIAWWVTWKQKQI